MLTAEDLTYFPPISRRPLWPPLRFDTKDAHFVLLSGPSGSGKSTLLRIICGLLPGFRGGRLEGSVAILGSPIPGQPDGRAGMLFQNTDAMLHSPRVADELLSRLYTAHCAPRRGPAINLVHGWPGELVETFELGGLLNRRIVELSGGEQQRVALAAVLATRPEIVLLDEPTSNLDPQAAVSLVKLLALCSDRFGTRFVAAEHRADHLLDKVDGAIKLEKAYWMAEDIAAAGTLHGPIPAPADQPAQQSDGCSYWSGPPGTAPADVLPGWLDLSTLHHFAHAEQRPAPGLPVLTCRNLSCRRSGRHVLTAIDLDLRAGEIVGLAGPNGAGKSSLLLLLAGGLKPGSGSEIRWHSRTPGESATANVGLLLQNPLHQLFCETAREEVAMAARNAGSPSDPGHLDRLLAAANLVDLADRPTLTLSYGEQQRTALAAAMSARPPVVLLDEPTHGMDAEHLAKIIRFLLDARQDGTAFIVASHDNELLYAFCDRVLTLRNGKLLTPER